MGNTIYHHISKFHMGFHHLLIEEGRQFCLPQDNCVWNVCNTRALGNLLLELVCPGGCFPCAFVVLV